MIVTLSGITGIGKSFYKNVISDELGFKNMVIVTTRQKRTGEVNGIDKEFVSLEEFEKLKKQGIIKYDFEFLGNRYGYKTDDLDSFENQVTELHYSTIYDFKKNALSKVFSIYLVPANYEDAKMHLKKRGLPKEVEEKRLKEIEEHIKEYSNNEMLQKQFDLVFTNNYDEKSKNELLNILKDNIYIKN